MQYLPEIFSTLWSSLMTIKIPSTDVPILGFLVGCMIFAVAIHFLSGLLGFGDSEKR